MKKVIYIICITFCLFVFQTQLNAQTDYEKVNLGGFNTYSMVSCSGDIDKDGDIDVISTDSGQIITWLENTGNMYFKPKYFTSTLSIKHMELIDFDNDNDLDILTWSSDSMPLGVLIQNANMEFQDSILYDSLYNSNVILTDFDNNGHTDILFTTLQRQLTLLKNANSVEILDSNFYNTCFDVVDFDNDGDMDIIRPYYINHNKGYISLSIHENLGGNAFSLRNDTFTLSHQILQDNIPSHFGSHKKLKIVDINTDGHLDIILLNQSGPLYQNQLNIYFTENDSTVRFDQLNLKANDFKLAKFNNDNKTDLLVCGDPYTWRGYKLYKYLYTDSNFTEELVNGEVSFSGTAGYCKDISINDVNNDSIDDIFYSLSNKSANTSSIRTAYGSYQTGFTKTPLLMHDHTPMLFNTTGKNFMTNKRKHIWGNDYLLFLDEYNGVKYFHNQTNHYSGAYPDVYSNYVDIDLDGDLDIINGSHNTDSKRIFMNNQSVAFPENTFIDPLVLIRIGFNPEHYETTRLKDIDSDGDLDFFITQINSNNANEIYWYKRTGSWDFTLQNTLVTLPASVQNYQAIEMDDLNGDNLLDFVLLDDFKSPWETNNNDTIALLKNQGAGNYTVQNQFTCYNYRFSKDIDLDGDLDILAQDSMYINEGNFNLTSIAYPLDVDMIFGFKDYDYDNDLDFFARTHTNELKWFINNGNLNFTSTVLITDSLQEDESKFVPIDYLNDGDWDIISYGGLSPTLYENTTDYYVSLDEYAENKSQDHLIHLSPNPARNYITIDGNLNLDHIKIYNQMGQLVMSKNIISTQSTIDCSRLQPGIYQVFLKDNANKIYTETLVINK